MEELGRSQTDLPGNGGPAPVTTRKVLNGLPVSPQVLRRLDDGLDWAPGTGTRILASGDAGLGASGAASRRPAQGAPSAPVVPIRDSPVLAAIADDPDLTEETKLHLSRQYGLLLRISMGDAGASRGRDHVRRDDLERVAREGELDPPEQ
jgi:hypothetical protein